MSPSTDPPILLACPQCKTKLSAPASMVGTRIECPKCHAKVLVPGVAGKSSANTDQEDWFALEATDVPVELPESPKQESPHSVFDDDLPDLAPISQLTPPAIGSGAEKALRDALAASQDILEDPAEKQRAGERKSNASGSPARQAETRSGSSDKSTSEKSQSNRTKTNREYSVSCTVCQTLLTVRESDAGKKIKCPDCFSMVLVPQAPTIKPTNQPRPDEYDATVQLSPVEGHNPRIVSGASVNTKEILSKASQELERERQELETIKGTFDSKEWLSRTFGFLSDIRLVITLVLLGSAFSALFYFVHTLIPNSTQTQLSNLLHTFREDLLLLVVPLQIPLFICAVAVIPKAANRIKRIDPWPFFGHWKEYLAPACIALVVFLTISILAGMLSTLGSFVKIPILLRDAFTDVLQWAFLPLIYLSMLESHSYMKPFTKSIIKSVSIKPDAWGAMYMQTAIAWVLYFVCWQIGILNGPSWSAFAGFLFPWFLCFIANQYGVLAGRLSDVTELGYEGVFTESE